MEPSCSLNDSLQASNKSCIIVATIMPYLFNINSVETKINDRRKSIGICYK